MDNNNNNTDNKKEPHIIVDELVAMGIVRNITLEGDMIMTRGLAKVKAKYLAGMKEHGGVGMSNARLSRKDWLLALQEEAIDTVFYTEVLLSLEEDEENPTTTTRAKGEDAFTTTPRTEQQQRKCQCDTRTQP